MGVVRASPDRDRPPVPVVVVGAGPVGLAAALLLARRGVQVLLLEQHQDPYPLPRAVHLDGEVLTILDRIGVGAGFRDISRPMPGMRLLDARHRVMATFRRDQRAGTHPEASMFDQPELEELLRSSLPDHPGVALRRGATVTTVEPMATRGVRVGFTDADGRARVVLASAVLGCDGANSTVREAIGAQLQDLGYTEPWLVIDAVSSRDLGGWGGVDQVCDPVRPATFLPVTGRRYRWEFRLAPGEDGHALTTPDGLARLLAPWVGPGGPDRYGLQVVRKASYTYQARIADRWRRERVFLLGDAAHQMPPFTGQGLGAGLRDADNLTWKLALVLAGRAPEAVLDTYQQEREPHVRHTIRLAMLVGWALTGGQGRAAALRRVLVAAACRTPGSSSVALRTVSPRLPAGPLVCPLPRRAGRGPAGTLFAGPGAGEPLGGDFVLVTLAPVAAATVLAARALDARVIEVAAPGPLTAWLLLHRLSAALVRPDGVVWVAERHPGPIAAAVAAAVAAAERTIVAPPALDWSQG